MWWMDAPSHGLHLVTRQDMWSETLYVIVNNPPLLRLYVYISIHRRKWNRQLNCHRTAYPLVHFSTFFFFVDESVSMLMGFVQRGRITGPKNKRLNFQRSVAIHLNYEVLAHPRWFLRGYSMIDYTDRTVFIVSTTWKDRAQPLYTICIITNSLRSVCIITWVDVTKPSPCCESVLSRNFVFTYFKKKERKKESSLCDLSITVKVMYDTITCQRRLRRRFVGFRMSPEELTVYSFSLECCCGT